MNECAPSFQNADYSCSCNNEEKCEAVRVSPVHTSEFVSESGEVEPLFLTRGAIWKDMNAFFRGITDLSQRRRTHDRFLGGDGGTDGAVVWAFLPAVRAGL